MGSAAIPAAAADRPVAVRSVGDVLFASAKAPAPVTRFIVHALTSPRDPIGHILANIILTEDLAPGASVSAIVPGPAATTSAAPTYLVAEVRVLDDPRHLATPRAQGFWYPVSAPLTGAVAPMSSPMTSAGAVGQGPGLDAHSPY
jgi:hypothetical protein